MIARHKLNKNEAIEEHYVASEDGKEFSNVLREVQ